MTGKERISLRPQLGEHVFIARNATVVGEVLLKASSSVWFGAVLRGDSDRIEVGERTNIQDNAVVHCDPGAPAIIGDDCVIGHLAVVHGARLGNRVLVGMNATVLNNARIGNNVIIGAGALVPAGMVVPDNSLVLGVPAKIVRELGSDQIRGIEENVRAYVEKAKEYTAAGF
jgi:carbonic anhydrase/acetyltransferase-like protein (isoleucine patch superfamily)